MKILTEGQRLECSTKYPIFLVHGTGFRDDNKFYNYWGRIPRALTDRGARVFYGGQDSWGNIEKNAEIIKESLHKYIKDYAAEKVNIIAHSKGGLESRYMISRLGMAKHVASLTTISTPHHGSKSIDMLYDFPDFLFDLIAFFVNLANKVMGDKYPDFHRACKQLSERECRSFNEAVMDSEGILYQSYGTKLKYPISDLIYFYLNIFISAIEGDNDGLVPVISSKWGNFKGIIESPNWRGVSHSDVVDLWRANLFGFDIREVYINIVKDLKANGY